jgi:hypothetical protein
MERVRESLMQVMSGGNVSDRFAIDLNILRLPVPDGGAECENAMSYLLQVISITVDADAQLRQFVSTSECFKSPDL